MQDQEEYEEACENHLITSNEEEEKQEQNVQTNDVQQQVNNIQNNRILMTNFVSVFP